VARAVEDSIDAVGSRPGVPEEDSHIGNHSAAGSEPNGSAEGCLALCGSRCRHSGLGVTPVAACEATLVAQTRRRPPATVRS
jgi:hypothetical protein